MFKKLAGFFAQPKEIEVNKTKEEIDKLYPMFRRNIFFLGMPLGPSPYVEDDKIFLLLALFGEECFQIFQRHG